jgi:hypothetical protein
MRGVLMVVAVTLVTGCGEAKQQAKGPGRGPPPGGYAEPKVAQAAAPQISASSKADAAEIEKSKTIVGKLLKDPYSAVYSDIFVNRKFEPTVCGFVNSKNSYGAYVGRQRFYARGEVAGVDTGLPDWEMNWIRYCS